MFIHVSNKLFAILNELEDNSNYSHTPSTLAKSKAPRVEDINRSQVRVIIICPENFEHPRDIHNICKDLMEKELEYNILFHIFTNSPYLLQGFEELGGPADNIIVHQYSEDGSLWNRLSEHPSYEYHKGSLTAGEFWDAEGEDWVSNNNFCFGLIENKY